jgi:hypothetical protein
MRNIFNFSVKDGEDITPEYDVLVRFVTLADLTDAHRNIDDAESRRCSTNGDPVTFGRIVFVLWSGGHTFSIQNYSTTLVREALRDGCPALPTKVMRMSDWTFVDPNDLFPRLGRHHAISNDEWDLRF